MRLTTAQIEYCCGVLRINLPRAWDRIHGIDEFFVFASKAGAGAARDACRCLCSAQCARSSARRTGQKTGLNLRLETRIRYVYIDERDKPKGHDAVALARSRAPQLRLAKFCVPFLDERADAFREIILRCAGGKALGFSIQLLAHGV